MIAETDKGLKAVALSAVSVVTNSVTAEALAVAAEVDQSAPEAAGVIPTTLADVRIVIPLDVTTDAAPAALAPQISAEVGALPGETTVTIEAVLPLAEVAAAQALGITALPTDHQMNVKVLALIALSAPPWTQEVLQDAISEDQDREITRRNTSLPQASALQMKGECTRMEQTQKATVIMMQRRAATSKEH